MIRCSRILALEADTPTGQIPYFPRSFALRRHALGLGSISAGTLTGTVMNMA